MFSEGILGYRLSRLIRGVLISLIIAQSFPSTSRASGTLATHGFSTGWATIGQVLPQGAARGNLQIGNFPTQTDVKTRWPDGSIRFAVLTANIPSSQYADVTEAGSNGIPFTPTIPSLYVVFTIAGAVYTANLPSQPSNDLWLNGGLVNEFRSVVTPINSSNVSHPFLRVYFDTRVYNDGKARVDVTVENTMDVAAANAVTYDVQVISNSQTLLSKTGLFHPLFARWRMKFNLNGLVESDITPDFEPIHLAKAMPRYLQSIRNETYAVSGPDYEFFHRGGNQEADMRAPGWRQELGLAPEWVVAYSVYKTLNQRQHTLINGDLGGGWPTHIRNADQTFVSIDQRPNYWPDARWSTGGATDGPVAANRLLSLTTQPGGLSPDNAHMPTLVYYPYLLTGDRYYADEMAFWTDFEILASWPGPNQSLRQGRLGLLLDNQVRGFAWVIRDLANTAAYLPDNHPLKNYFVEKIGNNLTWLEQHCGPEGLGIVSAFKDYWPMNSSDPSHVYISPWQEQYVAWAIDNANRQGFVGALNVRDTVARFSLSLLTHDVDFRQYGGPYYMIVGDRNTTTRQITWYTTWDQVHQANGWTPGGISSAPLTGYYGPEARIMSIINLQNNVPRAQEAYDYLWPLVAIQPHRGGIPDIIDRSNLALDFDTPRVVGNRPPVVYAGPNKSIGAAPISVALQGSAADDNLPNPPARLTIQWSKVSGPGNAVFTNPSSPTSSVSFSADGLYVLRLSASDSALTSTDDVTIGVNTQAPQPGPGPGPAPAPSSFVFRNQIVKGDGPAKFEFALKNAGPVEIDIVDRSGKIITTLNEDRLAGDNTMLWDMKNVPSGTFFALLKTPEKKEKAKIVHIR